MTRLCAKFAKHKLLEMNHALFSIYGIVVRQFGKRGLSAADPLRLGNLENCLTKRSRHYALAICCLLSLLIACRSPEGATWQRIQETAVLRVGLDPTFPPFETADDGDLRGLDVDLALALAADLGLRAEFVYFGYDGLYDALATGQVDVLISALVVQPERTRDFSYSDSYFNAGERLIVPGDSGIGGMADLDGRTLAVEVGAQGHVEAITWARRLANLTVLPYNTADEALTAVLQGDADATLVDAISGHLYLMNESGLKSVQPAVTQEPYALVVRIEDQLLLRNLNDSLRRLKSSGQLETIIARWLAHDS